MKTLPTLFLLAIFSLSACGPQGFELDIYQSQQWQPDHSAALEPKGRSFSADAVLLGLEFGPKVSRGWLRACIEVELKAPGQAFDGRGTRRSPWTPLGPGTQTLFLGLRDLKAQSAYRWRARVCGSTSMEANKPEELRPWIEFGPADDLGADFLSSSLAKAKQAIGRGF